MAFSATVRGTAYLGALRLIYGDWTGSSGDAAGTVTISGPKPYVALFQKFDAIDRSYQIVPRVEVSTTSGITTITVENQDDVTTGSFMILSPGA